MAMVADCRMTFLPIMLEVTFLCPVAIQILRLCRRPAHPYRSGVSNITWK